MGPCPATSSNQVFPSSMNANKTPSRLPTTRLPFATPYPPSITSRLLPHTTPCTTQQSSYFSAQQTTDYHPACRISPTSALQVSLTIRILVAAHVPFAIKSGGHSYVPGLSNIDSKGITIDLSSLSSIAISLDKSRVCISVGATWNSIYLLLETHMLSVAGSRAGSVGAGGYLLGGGLSWFSSQAGWACDLVEEFEVVLANGDIVLANSRDHADLFWALKGGGASFGIVTQVRMRTINVGRIYGGAVAYASNYTNELIEALVYGHLRTMNISDSAAEMSEDGERLRQVKFTLTLQSHAIILKTLYGLFVAFAGPLLSGSQSTDLVAMTLQPLSSSHLSWRDNALGFPPPSEPPSEPLMLLSLDARWTSPSDDAYMEGQVRRVCREMKEGAAKGGSLHRFVYMNYAARWQSPLDGYGDASRKRLQNVKEKYDPRSVF